MVLAAAFLGVSRLVAGAGPAEEAPGPVRPNVLVILADDLADWHLGCYGNQEIKTPHLDRLAREGIRMANSFVATPICSPSRATFFTGRVPRQHGIHDFLTGGGAPARNPEQGQREPPASFRDEVMVSDLLAAGGYECGYVGKWHMGGDGTPQHGYSYWRGALRGSRYVDPEFAVDGRTVMEPGYATEVFTRLAVEFIRRPHARPWFLVASYHNPHVPYDDHPRKYYDLYRETRFESFGIEPRAPNALREGNYLDDPIANLRKAAAATTALDDQIPVLLAALDETGARSRTLVLFTGDNGFLYGRHGAWSKGWATNPINLYEEVVRVPLIFSFPGTLPGGRVLGEFVSFYDVLPTLLEACGLPERFDRERLCGRSYWQILRGERREWENAVFFNFRYASGIRTERFKLVLRGGEGPDELFDLAADPREKTNRIGDPALAETREALRKKLEAWLDKYRA
jgi:arylsulfatase A-like enzyme